jgi:hypothetical protein
MQLKLHHLLSEGRRLIPREIPRRLLLTGPKIILSNKNVAIEKKLSANLRYLNKKTALPGQNCAVRQHWPFKKKSAKGYKHLYDNSHCIKSLSELLLHQ